MWSMHRWIWAFVLLVGCSEIPEPPGKLLQSKLERVTAQPDPAVFAARVEANTKVGLKLYRGLVDGDDNLFFSPHSIISVLGLAFGGAANGTRTEFEGLLLAPQPSDFHRSMNALERAIASRGAASVGARGEPFALVTLNQVFVDAKHPVEPAYLDLLQQEYGLGARQLDFVSAADAALSQINDWVETATRQRIPAILGPRDVSSQTRVVLVNAMYFSSGWATNFTEGSTTPLPFHGLAGSVDVQMMRAERLSAREFETNELQAVEVAYSGRELSMLIIMPKSDFRAWEATLNSSVLNDVRSGLVSELLDLSMPRFEMSSRRDLRPPLESLGLVSAFASERADFSSMSSIPTHLEGLRHEAWIDVSESGTRAAAATAGGLRPPSVDPEPKRVIIDRPFFFVIQDDLTKTVLFAGRFVKPN